MSMSAVVVLPAATPTSAVPPFILSFLCQALSTYVPAGTPLISCAAAEVIVNPVAQYVFKTPQKDSYAAQKIFQTMKDMGISKIAVLAGNTGFGKAGKSACNRYNASVREGEKAGEMLIGAAMVTMMSCPEELMKAEREYLAALSEVTSFSFHSGRLALNAKDAENGLYTMLFEQLENSAP